MNLLKHLASAAADSLETGLRSIGWGQPTAPTAWETGLVEAEAGEEVHEARCNCHSKERVDEIIDTAIQDLNELFQQFNHEPPGADAPSTAAPGLNLTDAERRTVVDALNVFRDGFVSRSVHWNAVTDLYERLRTHS